MKTRRIKSRSPLAALWTLREERMQKAFLWAKFPPCSGCALTCKELGRSSHWFYPFLIATKWVQEGAGGECQEYPSLRKNDNSQKVQLIFQTYQCLQIWSALKQKWSWPALFLNVDSAKYFYCKFYAVIPNSLPSHSLIFLSW